MIESAIIIAADTSSAASPLLPDRPPILWPVLGKPMVLQAMDPLYRAGIKQFSILLGMSDTSAISQLQRRWMPDAQIQFALKMPDESLTTALHRVGKELQQSDDMILVHNYNTFLDSSAQATLLNAALENNLTLAQTSNDDETFAGTACFRISILDNVGQHPKVETLDQLLKSLAQQAEQATTITPDWAIHVQSIKDLLHINTQLLANSPDSYILSEVSANVRIIPPVHIDPQVSIGQGAVIGPNVYLERGTRIGYRAHINNALVLDRGTVDANQVVSDAIITTNGTLEVT